jgi:hypothetical protein
MDLTKGLRWHLMPRSAELITLPPTITSVPEVSCFYQTFEAVHKEATFLVSLTS